MYILQTLNNHFVKDIKKDIILTSVYEEAAMYKTIGEAMQKATIVNNALGGYIVSVTRVN